MTQAHDDSAEELAAENPAARIMELPPKLKALVLAKMAELERERDQREWRG